MGQGRTRRTAWQASRRSAGSPARTGNGPVCLSTLVFCPLLVHKAPFKHLLELVCWNIRVPTISAYCSIQALIQITAYATVPNTINQIDKHFVDYCFPDCLRIILTITTLRARLNWLSYDIQMNQNFLV